MKIKLKCRICGKKEQFITVNEVDYKKFKKGEAVNSAFPYLTQDQQGLLETNLCRDCWKEKFPDLIYQD